MTHQARQISASLASRCGRAPWGFSTMIGEGFPPPVQLHSQRAEGMPCLSGVESCFIFRAGSRIRRELLLVTLNRRGSVLWGVYH